MNRWQKIAALDAEHTSGLDSEAAADALNTPVAARRPIAHEAFVGHLYDSGVFDAVLIAAGADDPTAKAVIAKLDYAVKFGLTTVDLDKSATLASLDAMRNAGLITPEQQAAIVALGDTQMSLAEQVGVGRLKAGDIEEARRLQA